MKWAIEPVENPGRKHLGQRKQQGQTSRCVNNTAVLKEEQEDSVTEGDQMVVWNRVVFNDCFGGYMRKVVMWLVILLRLLAILWEWMRRINDSRVATYQDGASRVDIWKKMILFTCLYIPHLCYFPPDLSSDMLRSFSLTYLLSFLKIPNSPGRTVLTSFPSEAMIRAQVEREERAKKEIAWRHRYSHCNSTHREYSQSWPKGTINQKVLTEYLLYVLPCFNCHRKFNKSIKH